LFFFWWNTLIYCNWRGRFVSGNCHNLCHWTVSSEDSCTRCTNWVVGFDALEKNEPGIYIYITNLVCYTYFHWFFSPECQHIFGKQMGYIFQFPEKIKTPWTCIK
jgi:hypothetical protein